MPGSLVTRVTPDCDRDHIFFDAQGSDSRSPNLRRSFLIHLDMPACTTRIVVQHTMEYDRWVYRLVAYNDIQTYRPVNFDTLDMLVRAMSAAIPGFADSSLRIQNGADRSYIVFSGDWKLSDSQLSALGFTER